MELSEKKRLKVLVVDDDTDILKTLKRVLSDYDVTLIADGKQAIDSIKSGNKYDLLVIDFRLQAYSGLDILMEAKEHLVCYKAILLTAYSNEHLLEQVVNNNLVYKVFKKPLPKTFLETVDEAAEAVLKEIRKSQNYAILSATVKSCDQIALHKSEIMKEAVGTAIKYAGSVANLILTGENGVGKEVFANIVHSNGKRAGKPFIKVNCSAIPEHLFESEFFGYEKGAFTGAIRSNAGKFKLADGGSIFLDEIGELSLNLQPKLLRVIETKEFSPLGSTVTLKTDARIICATNVDLKKRVEAGQFREDLFYRLNILNIHVPSLRERREDIPILAMYFLNSTSLIEGGPEREFSSEALEYLSNLEYKGNVRDLKNLVYRLYLCGDTREITLGDVIAATKQHTVSTANPFDEQMPLSTWSNMMERKKIELTLAKCNNNVAEAAVLLGMQRTNLYKKIRSLGLVL